MPKLQQRAGSGWSSHRFSTASSVLVQVHGDQPGVVTSHDMRAVVGERKSQTSCRVWCLLVMRRSYWQTELSSGHQPAFGQLDAVPQYAVVWVRRVIKVGINWSIKSGCYRSAL
jgi:hypothetical protein